MDLVLGEQGGDLLAEVALGDVGAEELEGDLVEVRQVRGAELVEAVGLHALVGDLCVALEALAVREVLLGDGEEGVPAEVGGLLALGGGAEDGPADHVLDEVREVVVQRGDLEVGAGVGEVDRVEDAVLAQRLAGVELPAEERVDGEAGVGEDRPLLAVDEEEVDLVAVVEGGAGVVLDDVDLRSDADGADEQVEGVDGLLQVHDPLARFFVGSAQLLRVVDAGDADPGAAVVGLHEERVAEALADLLELPLATVALHRGVDVGVVGEPLLGRDHPGLGDRHPELHHGAVGGVLLHRLQRPRVVEHVEAVHDDGLLDPLAAGMEPVGEAVEDHVVADRLAQEERVDGDAFDVEVDAVAADRDAEVQPLDDLLEAAGPADVGAER